MKKENYLVFENDPRFELLGRVEVGAASLAKEGYPEKNEDVILVDKNRLFFGVFDGMSERRSGGAASRIAKEFVEKQADEIGPEMTPEEAVNVLGRILEEANDEIFLMSREAEYMGMGTTALLVKLLKNGEEIKAAAAYVGNSRLYRFSKDEGLTGITLDDGPVRDQFHDERQARELQKKLSNISSLRDLNLQEFNLFLSRNRVGQYLGCAKITPHLEIVDIKDDDILILTSDGVHDNLTDVEMEAICRSCRNIEEAAKRLTESSLIHSRDSKELNIRAHPDDISAIVIKMGKK